MWHAKCARSVRTCRWRWPLVSSMRHCARAGEAGVRELIFKANAVEALCEAFVRLAQTVAKKSRGG